MPSNLPTKEQNPSGLHQRYRVQMADGSECDPRAVYFVLRLDRHGDDQAHIKACRHAAHEYCDAINCDNFAEHLWPVASQLESLVEQLESEAIDAE